MTKEELEEVVKLICDAFYEGYKMGGGGPNKADSYQAFAASETDQKIYHLKKKWLKENRPT